VKLCVDHNHLFDPAFMQAKALVEQGAIGEPVWVESFEGFDVGAPDNPYVKPWRGRSLGASTSWWDISQPCASPRLSLAGLPWVTRESTSGCPEDGRVPTAYADELRVLVRADEGLGCFMVSLSIQPFMKYVHIYGTEATIYVNLSTNSLTLLKNRRLPRELARGCMGLRRACSSSLPPWPMP
jgi:predicted dehydrogenase